ncbi:hypothetical protein PR001_g26795 [Phytophthora rubi]|uniref:PiggyBac transposable element-derived protein domain-containing protein n=1 Tax=Phytophthora rubi TaxID=129364 RepID=A0A6A3HVJ2_9STRA|nr:hypothetical protein PR001_g26795 [Phytophthora rubi]
MKAYHRWMGGVDVHDQLRLQRYSLQMPLRFREYYKSLALGLIDIAIVNSFIVYREACKIQEEPPADLADYITQLHAQLLAIGPAEFADMMYSPGPATPTCDDASSTSGRHRLKMNDEWVEVNGIRKRRQRQCKVCTNRKTVRSKRQMTRFYCAKRSKGSKRVYLCDNVRQGHYPNNNMTCYEIWHQLWRNGTVRPQPRCGRGIQMRAPDKKSTDADEEADDDQDTTGGANSNAPDGATGGGALEENRDNGSNDGAANEEEGGAGNREEDGAGNKESNKTGQEEGDNTGHEEGTDKENSSRSDGAVD